MSCQRIQKTRKKLCTGDMDQYAEVQLRKSVASAPGQYDPQITFTTIGTWPFLVKTFTGNGTARFAGVNIAEGNTHVFITRRFPESEALEAANHFFLLDGRRFRIRDRIILDEDPYAIMFQCAERGDDDLHGADA